MNKGFTLVELLAVMVLLSIIALITIPAVLKTVDKAERRSLEVSGSLYIKAIEKAIVEKNEETEWVFYPNKCQVNNNGNITCDNNLEEIKIKTSGDRPNSGEILFEDGTIISSSLVFGEQLVLMDGNGDFKLRNNKYICNRVKKSTLGNVPQGKYAKGDEYICEVSTGVFYNFFVVKTSGDNVYLILSHNIDSEGNLVTLNSTSSGDVETNWNNETDYSAVITFLRKATNSWDNPKILDIFVLGRGNLEIGANSKKSWIYANLDNDPNTRISSAYWTGPYWGDVCFDEDDDYFCGGTSSVMEYDGSLSYRHSTGFAGVRPAIEVSKSNLE